MNRLTKIFFLIFLILLVIILSKIGKGQIIKNPSEFKIQPICRILDKIDEDESDLIKISLKISSRKYSYQEPRIKRNFDGSIASKYMKTFTDPEREIAFLLLNVETCGTQIIKVIKRGNSLVTPVGYDIRAVQRTSGLTWNAFNTQFEVLHPASTIVLKNAWPKEETRKVIVEKRNRKGKIQKTFQIKKYIKNVIYTLYSADNQETKNLEPGIHLSELVNGGAGRLKSTVNRARDNLRNKEIFSRVFSGQIVGDLPFLLPESYERIMLAEQTDYNEFLYNKRKAMERALVILRANGGRAFASCNSQKPWKACGIVQFTDRWRIVRAKGKTIKSPGTYSTIVREYPKAKLIKEFPAGVFDHVNAFMSEILLHDYNSNLLFRIFGEEITDDPVLFQEALAGYYNGGPRPTTLAFEEYFNGEIDDWIKSKRLPRETKEYIIKYRYAAENNLP